MSLPLYDSTELKMKPSSRISKPINADLSFDEKLTPKLRNSVKEKDQ